jgi:DedD protein
MDRTTKHRILGILVVIGLVIILLPLFQGGKDIPTETVSIKAPAFPDQAVQVASTTSEIVTYPQQPVIMPSPVSDENVKQQPDDVISATHVSVVNTQVPEIATPNIPNTPNNVKTPAPPNLVTSSMTPNTLDPTAQDNNMQDVKPAPIIKKVAHAGKRTPSIKMQTAYIHQSNDTDGLVKLTNAVWVIQLGSFKNKTNALRLVNQLRASGYRAFIQQVASNTRVYVGPENRQTSARALANQLENSLHLRGIVISYQPLTL